MGGTRRRSARGSPAAAGPPAATGPGSPRRGSDRERGTPCRARSTPTTSRAATRRPRRWRPRSAKVRRASPTGSLASRRIRPTGPPPRTGRTTRAALRPTGPQPVDVTQRSPARGGRRRGAQDAAQAAERRRAPDRGQRRRDDPRPGRALIAAAPGSCHGVAPRGTTEHFGTDPLALIEAQPHATACVAMRPPCARRRWAGSAACTASARDGRVARLFPTGDIEAPGTIDPQPARRGRAATRAARRSGRAADQRRISVRVPCAAAARSPRPPEPPAA